MHRNVSRILSKQRSERFFLPDHKVTSSWECVYLDDAFTGWVWSRIKLLLGQILRKNGLEAQKGEIIHRHFRRIKGELTDLKDFIRGYHWAGDIQNIESISTVLLTSFSMLFLFWKLTNFHYFLTRFRAQRQCSASSPIYWSDCGSYVPTIDQHICPVFANISCNNWIHLCRYMRKILPFIVWFVGLLCS